MSSVNKVILVGNLGRDPESRSFQNGGKVVEMRIATSDSWKDRQTGEKRERTEWHTVKIFSEGLANVAERYLRKGSKVYIEGALTTRKWQDQSGSDRYSTEIVLQGYHAQLVLLGDAGGGQRGGGQADGGRSDRGTAAGASRGGDDWSGGGGGAGGGFPDDLDDDVPF